MEEIEVFCLDGLLIDSGKCFGVDFQLGPVTADRLRQGSFCHTVGLEIHNGDAVRFQQGAIHHTLKQHMLPVQPVAILIALVQNGEFELPQAGYAPAQGLADVAFKEGGDGSGVDQGSAFRCQVAFA